MGFDWRNFLEHFSQRLLSDEQIQAQQSQEVLDSRWLGFAGATNDEIKKVEDRIGIELPTSYRLFLQTSNGWRNSGKFINRIWSTNEIAWFKERNQEWSEAYNDPYENLPTISDKEYFKYGHE
ncbi:SMI1/KNR4 family protein, partial [bacterium]|nr:SMI1/KNR4 family protein [bacterium]